MVAGLEVRHGGPPRVAASLTSALSRTGVSSTIFSPAYAEDEEHLVSAPKATIRMFEIGRLARWWPGYSLDLKSALQQEAAGFDVVHIHELWHHPHFAAARVCKALGVPFVVSPHGSLDPWALAIGGLKKRIYSRIWQRDMLGGAAAAHALTATENAQLRDYGYDGPVAVIPNGVNVDEFQQQVSPSLMDEKYVELIGKKVILFLGRLHSKKGLDVLVRAFADIYPTNPGIHLLIVGPDDGYETELKRLIGRMGINCAVTLTGILTGKARLAAMARADIYALPSYSEGFSVGVLEALAAGLPVVISKYCYLPEVVSAGAGLEIEPEVRQVSSALGSLIENPERALKMGRAGRDFVRSKYSWDTVATSFVDLYKSNMKVTQ